MANKETKKVPSGIKIVPVVPTEKYVIDINLVNSGEKRKAKLGEKDYGVEDMH